MDTPPPQSPKQPEPVGPMVGIVIIVLVLLAGGIYFFLMEQQERSEITPSQEQARL